MQKRKWNSFAYLFQDVVLTESHKVKNLIAHFLRKKHTVNLVQKNVIAELFNILNNIVYRVHVGGT